jgi:hypothetical protein
MLRAQLGLLAVMFALAIAGVSAAIIWGVGSSHAVPCLSSAHHYMAEPKAGPGRPPPCPMLRP